MSENRNRTERDLSQYASMSTEELEQILRLDCEAPETKESDMELILYVMEVLAQRNKENNTGKTAQEAWESFQRDYLPELEEDAEDTPQEPTPVKTARSWKRRLIAIAAVVALVAGLVVGASAFGWENIWNAVATWAKETFSFVSSDQEENIEPSPRNSDPYASLREALAEINETADIVPTWLPEGYLFKDLTIDENPMQRVYVAIYRKGEDAMILTVRSYIDVDPEKVEVNDDLLEIYETAGKEHYIFSNNQQLRAVWITGSYECFISGKLTIEEIKMMIDSIGKG